MRLDDVINLVAGFDQIQFFAGNFFNFVRIGLQSGDFQASFFIPSPQTFILLFHFKLFLLQPVSIQNSILMKDRHHAQQQEKTEAQQKYFLVS